MSRDTPPLAEGQLGFPLERREIVASLGKEKAGSTWEGLFTMVSALGMAPHCFWVGLNTSVGFELHLQNTKIKTPLDTNE